MRHSLKSMLQKKRVLLILGIVVAAAALIGTGCSSNKAKPVDPQQLLAKDVARTDNQGAVTVKAALVNPIAEVGPEITFELTFDTHSVDLSSYDILANVSLTAGNGIYLTGDDMTLEGNSGDSHHRTGLLIAPLELLELNPELEKLTLELYDLSGVAVRQFVWEKELLFNK